MKKILLFLLVLVVVLQSCEKQNRSPNIVTLKGQIKGMTKGELCLQRFRDTTYLTVDTYQVSKDGQFEFYDTLMSPEMYYIHIKEYPSDKIMVFAEPGVVEVNSRIERFSSDVKVVGSENNELLTDYKKVMQRFVNENLDLIKGKIEAEQKGDTTKLSVLKKRHNNHFKRKYLYATNYAVKHADHEIAPFIALSDLYAAPKVLLDTIYKSLSDHVRVSHYGKLLKENIETLERYKDSIKQN